MCYYAQLIFVFLVETGFTMLVRLVLNSWAQAICLSRSPKVLGLQARATAPGPSNFFLKGRGLVTNLVEINKKRKKTLVLV